MMVQVIESLRAEERSLSFSTSMSDALEALELSPQQGFILSRIDGTTTPRDILAVSPLGEEETARALVDLLECGLVKLIGDAAPAVNPANDKKFKEVERLFELCNKQTPAELLGVADQATVEEIKKAFRQKVMCFHPDRYPDIADDSFRQKLSHLLTVTSDAFHILSENAGRKSAPAEPVENPPEPASNDGESYDADKHALELFAAAGRAYEAQDYWKVIQLCRQAIEIKDDVPKYHFLLGRALLQNKRWRKEAGESIGRATELDSYNAEYLALLAALYQAEGMETRATKTIEQARTIDPECEIPELPT